MAYQYQPTASEKWRQKAEALRGASGTGKRAVNKAIQAGIYDNMGTDVVDEAQNPAASAARVQEAAYAANIAGQDEMQQMAEIMRENPNNPNAVQAGTAFGQQVQQAAYGGAQVAAEADLQRGDAAAKRKVEAPMMAKQFLDQRTEDRRKTVEFALDTAMGVGQVMAPSMYQTGEWAKEANEERRQEPIDWLMARLKQGGTAAATEGEG